MATSNQAADTSRLFRRNGIGSEPIIVIVYDPAVSADRSSVPLRKRNVLWASQRKDGGHVEPRSMKVLVLFSDPPTSEVRLRLDREDKLISQLGKRYSIAIERLHASQIEDIHEVIARDNFDIIQFSGHGSPDGIYLEKADFQSPGDLVTVDRLESLLSIAEVPPRLAIFLSCFSNSSVLTLSRVAPFVISAVGEVRDDVCLEFIRCFYERHFSGQSISRSFDDAIRLLDSKSLQADCFRFDRRFLIQQGQSRYIQCVPPGRQNSIIVNLDAVASVLDNFGLQEEEICFLLARKLAIHYWIFSVPRDRCIIPIGRLLFGEFGWRNADDVVYCKRLLKLRPDVSAEHWRVWSKLLISYNDLASNEYRGVNNPADPIRRHLLRQAVRLFEHHVERYLKPARQEVERLGFTSALVNFEFVLSFCETARDQLELERIPQVVQALEAALTNYHEIVDSIHPPEDVL